MILGKKVKSTILWVAAFFLPGGFLLALYLIGKKSREKEEGMFSINMDPARQGPFRLKKVSDDHYQIHQQYGGRAFEGPKSAIFEKAVQMGVIAEELPVAVSEMRKMGHDVAEFGVGGGFMFTRDSSNREMN